MSQWGLLAGIEQAIKGGVAAFNGERDRSQKASEFQQEMNYKNAILKDHLDKQQRAYEDKKNAFATSEAAKIPQLLQSGYELDNQGQQPQQPSRAPESGMLPTGQQAASEQQQPGLIKVNVGGQNLVLNPKNIVSAREKFNQQGEQINEQKKNRNYQQTAELRKEYSGLPTTKDTQQVAASYGKILQAAQNPSAAGDLSLIFSYMRILDPGSTVREGEFANAQNSAGIPAQIRNIYNRAMNGERLAPEQREDFVSQAGNLYGAQSERQKALEKQYAQKASHMGIDPNDIVTDWGSGLEVKPKAKGGLLGAKHHGPKEQKAASGLLESAKSKPKQVIQNGHVYILNEQTGEYE